VPSADQVTIRPLTPDDVEGARVVAGAALQGVSTRLDREPHAWPDDEESRARSRERVARCAQTDPQGSWVAETDGAVVGVGLALRRGPLWFLSLLAVAEGLQGRGVGARLMDACLTTYDGAAGGLITVSRDPLAMRRYQLAGFALQPAFGAGGVPDPAGLPTPVDVRSGDLATDRELCHDVGIRLRGAAHGDDLDAMVAAGGELRVAEDGAERGFALTRPGSLWLLGATSDTVAARLLSSVLADAGRAGVEMDVSWLTADQQWALDVTLAARMRLHSGGSTATRGRVGPLTPYLPSGAWG